jgi:hypothetical protein
MDLTAVTASLGAISDNVETIGLVLLGAAAVAVAFKWAKATIFG